MSTKFPISVDNDSWMTIILDFAYFLKIKFSKKRNISILGDLQTNKRDIFGTLQTSKRRFVMRFWEKK